MSPHEIHEPIVVETTPKPVDVHERVGALDIIRGIALLGVLVSNIWMWFSGKVFLPAQDASGPARLWLDGPVDAALKLIVAQKALAIFAFLFGVGFAIQMRRAQTHARRTFLYPRRLAALFCFGLVHHVLLWYGDILTLYAVLGFILLAFRDRKDVVVLGTAVLLIVGVPLAADVTLLLRDPVVAGAGSAAQNVDMLAAFAEGNPARMIRANFASLLAFFTTPRNYIDSAAWLGMFLLGAVAGRRRVFEQAEERKALLWTVLVGGMSIAAASRVAARALRALAPELAAWLPINVLVLSVGAIPQALSYVAGLTLLLRSPAWRRRLRAFEPVGRMALTSYLTQTVICLALFSGYGASLVGRTGSAVNVGIALVIFALQIGWSRWWLGRFRFGPMEWLWRSITYGSWQPMRRAPEPQAL